jgi:3-oxoacyl-(acyl-carrier-protein) synthase
MTEESGNSSIVLRSVRAWTPAGEARETLETLLRGESILRLHPVDWQEGDAVPLSLDSTAREAVPPRWWERLGVFAEPLKGKKWGQSRTPVLLSSSNYGVGNLHRFHETQDPAHLAWGTPHRCAEQVRRALEWGPNVTLFSHACVTAQLALFHAEQLLRKGVADEVLVFSFDFLSAFVAGGFYALKILNGQFPTPYTDGPVGSVALGDGMGYAILGRAETGEKAPRIRQQALHNELHHFTANRSDGAGFEALLGQLQVGNLRPWVKGHGTGTLEAGKLEALAVQTHLPEAPLVSWKGGLGHTLGSCGMVELAIALEAQRTGQVPGTIGAGADLFAPNVAREPFDAQPFDSILCLSNAFGGAHAALLVTDV